MPRPSTFAYLLFCDGVRKCFTVKDFKFLELGLGNRVRIRIRAWLRLGLVLGLVVEVPSSDC